MEQNFLIKNGWIYNSYGMKHQSTAYIALTLKLQNYAEYFKLKTNKFQTIIQIEV